MRYRMRNALTGSIMEVDESRLEEYKSRGHALLDEPKRPEEPKPAEEPKSKKRGAKK